MLRGRTKILIAFVGFLVVIISFWIILLDGREKADMGTITTAITPSVATITIDGQKVKEGSVKVEPGRHAVAFSYKGFTPASRQVTVAKNEEVFVGEILAPSSPETQNWYLEHPEDRQKAEGISSSDYGQLVKTVSQKYPILADLPVAESSFRIDYGKSQKQPDNVEAVGIYIRAIDQQGRDDALNWIRTFGYDPDDYEIIYINPNEEL